MLEIIVVCSEKRTEPVNMLWENAEILNVKVGDTHKLIMCFNQLKPKPV
jgi:hypothetical protein